MMERLTHQGEHGPYWDKAVFDKHNGMEEDLIIDRLAYYEDMEEQGRLVVLPCKVGADIFRVGAKEVCDYWQITRAEIYTDEIVLEDDSDNVIFVEDFGKTVFLTREEAEQALKEGADHE